MFILKWDRQRHLMIRTTGEENSQHHDVQAKARRQSKKPNYQSYSVKGINAEFLLALNPAVKNKKQKKYCSFPARFDFVGFRKSKQD